MADIFLSYARDDLSKAKLFVAAFEKQGYSVFWDINSIRGGDDFNKVIDQAIVEAKCMVVLWSNISVLRHFVRDEAREGLAREILVPALIETVKPPLGFRSIHTEDLTAWNGDLQAETFQKLKLAVNAKLGNKTSNTNKTDAQANPRTTIIQPTVSIKPASPAKTQRYIEPEMVVIPAGSFLMGSKGFFASFDEKPIHQVTLKSFSLGRYPVTFTEYDLFVAATGSNKPSDWGWGREKRPVIDVSWHDAQAYIEWLNNQTGKTYRLPSEAEWEYAARAGTASDYYWGNGDINDFAWYRKNSGGKTQPVGLKQTNAFGLYDMSGNIWEWQQDNWHKNYDGAPSDGYAWRTKGDDNSRVLRGGDWSSKARSLRSANRGRYALDNRYIYVGFRLSQD